MSAPTTTSAQLLGLVGWLLVTFAAAGIGSMATMQAGDFYAQLERPQWAPPAWVFGPAWTILYTLMGVAAWLVWRERGLSGAPVALSLYLVQLAANALWSWLFFAWRLGGLAFAEVLVLWALIAVTALAFGRVRPGAGLLLVPYFFWVTYAATLNYAIWQRNPQLL